MGCRAMRYTYGTLAPTDRQTLSAVSCKRNAHMKPVILCLVASLASASFVLHAQTASPQYPNMPSETPAAVSTAQYGADYTRREMMIPMRDGVKLHTVILIPSGAHNAAHPPHSYALQRRRRSPRNAYSTHLGPASTAMTTPPTSSSKAATSASSRMFAASTALRATTS